MKQLMKSIALAGLMCIGGSAWAMPFTVGFTLDGSTDGNYCPTGCSGTLSIDGGSLGTLTDPTQAYITGVDIEITDSLENVVLTFGNQLFPGLVTIIDDAVTTINLSMSQAIGGSFHFLSIGANDWTLSGAVHSGGGSEVQVPEPSVLALLGLGLVAIGFTRRRKNVTV